MLDKQVASSPLTSSVYSNSSISDRTPVPSDKSVHNKKSNFLSRTVSSFPSTGSIKALVSKVMTAISKTKVSFTNEKPSRPLSASAEKKTDGSHSVALPVKEGGDFAGDVASSSLRSKSEVLSSDDTSELNTADTSGVDSIQENPSLSETHEKVLERAVTLPVLQRGELISADFKDADGRVFCQESVQRSRNVEVIESSLNAQLEALNKHEEANPAVKNNPQNRARRQHIESNLKALHSIKAERAKSGRAPPTWASTDAPRAHFRRCVNKLIGGRRWSMDPTQRKILRQMAIKDAKKESLAVTGNMRYQQTFIVSDEELEGYNHPELKGMITGENPGKVVKDPQIIERFNLYHTLKNSVREGGDLSKLEKDPSFQHEISLLKKEMMALGKKNDSQNILGLIKHMERTPISYLEPDGKGVVRSASITDFMHGETNVEDIRVLTVLLKMDPLNNDSYISLKPSERVLINKYYSNSVIKNLEFQSGAAEELKQKLLNDVKVAYPEKNFEGVAKDKLMGLLEGIALERDAHLMEKALQDLSAHLSNHPVAVGAGSVFFGRVGLVDTIKPPNPDPDGFCLNERSMAMDSSSAYRMLQGKKIVFDGDPGTPLMQDFENTDVIHAPKNWSQGAGEAPHEVKINATYVNISIAGNLDNTGVQNTINNQEISALETILNDSSLKDNLRAQELMKNIKQGTATGSKGGDFGVVADTLELMNMLGHASVNCYGGKDRTGYVCAVHDRRKMMTHLKNREDVRYKEGGSFAAALGRQMFAYNGIAVGVIRDNVAISAVKLARADLGLLLDGEGLDFLKGAARLAVNGVQFAEGFLPKIISSTLQKMASVQIGEGDLYN